MSIALRINRCTPDRRLSTGRHSAIETKVSDSISFTTEHCLIRIAFKWAQILEILYIYRKRFLNYD